MSSTPAISGTIIDPATRAVARELSDSMNQELSFPHALTVGRLKEALAALPAEDDDTLVVVRNGGQAAIITDLCYAWFDCGGTEEGTINGLDHQDEEMSIYEPTECDDVLAVVINAAF